MQPRWQKAQLKDDPDIHPFIRGKEVWLKIGAPRQVVGISWDGEPGIVTGYEINLEPLPGCPDSVLDQDAVLDLRAEFAEDVEIIPWAVWSKIE